jgi:RNA polymerase sigma-70 factor (ECF subfamily)
MSEADELNTSLTLLQEMLGAWHREQAWAVFVERYTPLILRWCRRQHLPEDVANDVTSDVLTKLVTRLSKYDPSLGSFRGWLKSVVLNAVRDHLRHVQRRPVESTGGETAQELLEQVEAPIDDELTQELEELDPLEQRVVDAVRTRIGETTWQAFWMKTCEDRPAAEVAEILDMSKQAVHQAAYRVSMMLREEYRRLRMPDNV